MNVTLRSVRMVGQDSKDSALFDKLDEKVLRLSQKLQKPVSILKTYYSDSGYLRATIQVEGEPKVRRWYVNWGKWVQS